LQTSGSSASGLMILTWRGRTTSGGLHTVRE
jgi:hypothetical protein